MYRAQTVCNQTEHERAFVSGSLEMVDIEGDGADERTAKVDCLQARG